MTRIKGLMAVAALALFAAVTPAAAHERDSYYDRHARDHAEHRQEHRNLNYGHERAHDRGFYSGAEHRAFHRELRSSHEDFHAEHPGTRHDHYRRW
jgi:Ni/Co efflux regulator RcnB